VGVHISPVLVLAVPLVLMLGLDDVESEVDERMLRTSASVGM